MTHIHTHQLKCDRCGAVEDNGDEARNWCAVRAAIDRRRQADGSLTGGPQTEADLCPKCAVGFVEWLGETAKWSPPVSRILKDISAGPAKPKAKVEAAP
jgi:hypothetical protein